jgi:hypothetical protein
MAEETLVTGTETTQTGEQQGAGGTKVEGATQTATQQTQGAAGEQKQGEGTKTASSEEFKVEVPEGIQLESAGLDELKAIVNDAALTPSARAQKLVDFAAKSNIEAHKQRVAGWAEETRNDPEVGGAKLNDTLAIARKTVALAPPEMKEVLEKSGLGNHPAFIKWAYAVGKKLSEDSFVPSGGASKAVPKDMANTLYGQTPNA